MSLRSYNAITSSLFKLIQQGFGQADTPERHRLFRQAKQELELHAEVEDLQVYASFSKRRPHATMRSEP
jgi:hypothetical protein